MVKTNKIILRATLILSYFLITSVILFLISSLFSYFNTGANRSEILHTKVERSDLYLPKITWKNDGNEGRFINNQTLRDVENDYLDAWYVKHIANKVNITTGLNDYYTKNARKNLFNFIRQNKKENIHIEATTLEHNPNIEFFSEDGQLIALKDDHVVEYKKVFKDDILIIETTEVSSYKAILLLEDNFWRIRHLVKEKTSELKKVVNSSPIHLAIMKGINYYPQATPWDMYGKSFNINVIDADFKIIKSAGLNTIRIFVPYEDFGKASVKAGKIDKLKQVLDTAEKNNIKVIVTLFDFYGNYDVMDWTLNQKHARTIVSTFKDHKAIIAWDIKNEPNLDFDSRGKETVIAWLEHLLILVKSIDKKHAVTIGWSNTKSAVILKDQVDFVSFHYYEDVDNFEIAYQLLQKKIPNRTIVLGEFGISSYGGFWKPFNSSKIKQAAYYKKIQKVLTKNTIPFLSWTLYDFNKIPEDVIGRLPWRVIPQKNFGFINKKGVKKPSFEFISK
jgi:hypothetical protein